MIESGRVPREGRICATIIKLSERVSEKVRIGVSTKKWWNPGEYRENLESMPLLKNCLDEYRKRVESV